MPPSVRIPSGYPKPFCFDLGQRNVAFVEGPLVRGSRMLRRLDSITFVRAAGCELMHTLNAVPILRKGPFLITFESYLPRVPDDRHSPGLERFLFKYLARPNCRRLIAFSDYALGQFKAQIARYPGYEKLLDKTERLYPAVQARATKPKGGPENRLRLLFVGRQFMHKGGPAVCAAHSLLRKRGIPVDTTVVSSLDWDPRGLVGPNRDGAAAAMLETVRSEGIAQIANVENRDLLLLMDEADFLVLPTVNDTFGFACIEALAGGTPVIATETCAIPEIVEDARNGFLLQMPTDERGRWTGLAKRRTAEYNRLYLELIDDLATQIADRLEAFFSDQSGYRSVSEAALDTINRKFDRDNARGRLEKVYEDALA